MCTAAGPIQSIIPLHRVASGGRSHHPQHVPALTPPPAEEMMAPFVPEVSAPVSEESDVVVGLQQQFAGAQTIRISGTMKSEFQLNKNYVAYLMLTFRLMITHLFWTSLRHRSISTVPSRYCHNNNHCCYPTTCSHSLSTSLRRHYDVTEHSRYEWRHHWRRQYSWYTCCRKK